MKLNLNTYQSHVCLGMQGPVKGVVMRMDEVEMGILGEIERAERIFRKMLEREGNGNGVRKAKATKRMVHEIRRVMSHPRAT